MGAGLALMLLVQVPLLEARLEQCRYPEHPDTVWSLPASLAEISGIAMQPDGRLIAHDDEHGRLWLLDPARRTVAGPWRLAGDPPADFEGVTLAAGGVVLATSAGVLYRVALPSGRDPLAVVRVRTGLGGRCEFEGLATEADGNILLLACKLIRRGGRDVGLRLYRWDLARGRLAVPATIEVSRAALRARSPWSSFAASAIERDPRTGHLLVLSARQRGILELSAAGAAVAARALAATDHRQPEGLTLSPRGDLLISDEAAGARATLSTYRCRG